MAETTVSDERRAQVAAALKAAMPVHDIGSSRVRQEIRELPEMLDDDELPMMATIGTVTFIDQPQSVLIVCTARRILITDRGHNRATSVDYLYADLRGVDARTGWTFGSIALLPKSGASIIIKDVANAHVRPFSDWLTRQVREARTAS